MLNEPLDKATFEAWMQRLIERTDLLENRVHALLKRQNVLEGEVLLDNQDLCFLLKVSKRSLQRYRSEGKLKYKQLEQKTYYSESEVKEFIKRNLVEITKDSINESDS